MVRGFVVKVVLELSCGGIGSNPLVLVTPLLVIRWFDSTHGNNPNNNVATLMLIGLNGV